MSVIGIHRRHEETLDDAVREINIAFGKSAEAEQKALSHRVRAGQLLNALRKRIEAGEAGEVTWWKWYVGRFARSRKDAEKVMALAGADDPEAAAKREREKAKDAMAKQRQSEKEKSSQPRATANVSGNVSAGDLEQPLDDEGPITPQDRKKIFLMTAAIVIEAAEKQKQILLGKIDDEIRDVASLAADEWGKLADELRPADLEQRKAEYAALDVSATAVHSVEDDLEGEPPEEFRRVFLVRCLDATGFGVYSGPVDNEVIAAAERVAAHWRRFAQKLKSKGGV